MKLLKESLGSFSDATKLRRLIFSDFRRNFRFGARILRRNPGFALVAVLTLSLGIGSNIAIFSVLNSVLLKPLNYPEPERLAVIQQYLPTMKASTGETFFPPSPRLVGRFLKNPRGIETFAAVKGGFFNLSTPGHLERIEGAQVTHALFQVLKVRPLLGRTFTAAEDRPGSNHEVILGYSLWRRTFGADPKIVGRFIQMNGLQYQVVGVMPAGFDFPQGRHFSPYIPLPASTQLWTPAGIPPEILQTGRGPTEYIGIARLDVPAASPAVQTDLDALAHQIDREIPRTKGFNFTRAVPLQDQLVGQSRPMILVLFGAVGFFMLIICVNISNLLLARISSRSRELAVRLALGASRLRLTVQILTENLVLVLIGTGLGLPLGIAGIHWIKVLGPQNVPRLQEVFVDSRVLAFTLLMALLAVALAALTPALQAGREDIQKTLREGGRDGASGRSGSLFRAGLIVSEVAICVVLLVGAGLLTRSLLKLLEVDPGFHAQHVLSMEVTLPANKYKDQQSVVHFYQRLQRQVEAQPAIAALGVSNVVPLAGNREGTVFSVEGLSSPSATPRSPTDNSKFFSGFTMVNSGYFRALGVPILRGRDFRDSDLRADALPVAVINQRLARRYFGEENPLGHRIKIGPPRAPFPWLQIVGVVPNLKEVELGEASSPGMYVPLTQKTYIQMETLQVVVRSSLDGPTLLARIKNVMSRLDPAIAAARVQPMKELVERSLARPRFSALLTALFAFFALLLAGLGLYGLIAFSVARQIHEIGVRMALGAQRGDVLKLVMRRGLMLTALGLGAGLAGAVVAARFLRSLLFQVQPLDPLTLAAISLLMLLIAALACLIPGRRASRVDPAVALRSE